MLSRFSIGTIGGLVGLAVGGYGGYFFSQFYDAVNGGDWDEGGRVLSAIVVFGPVGGLTGLALGVALGLAYYGPRTPIAEGQPRRRTFVLVLAFGLLAGVVYLYFDARVRKLTYSDGRDGYLIFDVRVTRNYPLHTDIAHTEDYTQVSATLKAGASWMRGGFNLPWREEGDWMVLAGVLRCTFARPSVF